MPKPINKMLEEFSKNRYSRFFMPGHKGIGNINIEHDITEVLDTDDLSSPTLAIKEANELLAKKYKMDFATMCTCGSSISLHSMLLCANGKVAIGKNAHKACINACYLYNIECEFIKDVSTKGYLDFINSNNTCSTLFITYPDYYGNGIDIEKVVKLAKEKGLMTIVDCAHGAHFPFSKKLPKLPNMADMFCVSSHKTMPSLTQASIVFSTNEYKDKLFSNLFKIHTTSPSYIIMESIDSGRDFLENNEDLVDRWIETCKYVKEHCNFEVIKTMDITRFVIKKSGYTGYELAKELEKYKIIAEMSDINCIVLITSPLDIESINKLLEINLPDKQNKGYDSPSIVFGKEYKPIHYTKNKEYENIDYKLCCGRVAIEQVGAYPPGIASVMPGEIITKDVIEFFDKVLIQNGHIFNMKEDKTIKVLKNE